MSIAAIAAAIALVAGFAAGWWLRGARRSRDELVVPAVEGVEPERAPLLRDLRRILNRLPLGVVLVDEHLRIAFANRSSARIFRFNRKGAVGEHILRAIPNVAIERRTLDALQGEASFETLQLGEPGRQRTFAISATPLPPDARGPRGVVLVAIDRTEVARLERARTEFLSNVSHELRTPLSSIRLMIETVLDSGDAEASALFLPQALAQVDRLTELVARFLEQASTESGHIRLRLREVDIEELARSIAASFEPAALGKGVNIEVKVARPVRLEGDPDRLAQVFVNLIDNALRHTPVGGEIAIEIDAEGSEAVLRVRDSGDGIPYRSLPHIFERFYVGDPSRAREGEHGGAGLGLAIVKGIVEAHRGSIAAESMLGHGATFVVRLPILRVARD